MLTSSPKVRITTTAAASKIPRARGALLNAALIQELLGIPNYTHKIRSSDGSVIEVHADADGAHRIEIDVPNPKPTTETTKAPRYCFVIRGRVWSGTEYQSVTAYIAKVQGDIRGHTAKKNAKNPVDGKWEVIAYYNHVTHKDFIPIEENPKHRPCFRGLGMPSGNLYCADSKVYPNRYVRIFEPYKTCGTLLDYRDNVVPEDTGVKLKATLSQCFDEGRLVDDDAKQVISLPNGVTLTNPVRMFEFSGKQVTVFNMMTDSTATFRGVYIAVARQDNGLIYARNDVDVSNTNEFPQYLVEATVSRNGRFVTVQEAKPATQTQVYPQRGYGYNDHNAHLNVEIPKTHGYELVNDNGEVRCNFLGEKSGDRIAVDITYSVDYTITSSGRQAYCSGGGYGDAPFEYSTLASHVEYKRFASLEIPFAADGGINTIAYAHNKDAVFNYKQDVRRYFWFTLPPQDGNPAIDYWYPNGELAEAQQQESSHTMSFDYSNITIDQTAQASAGHGIASVDTCGKYARAQTDLAWEDLHPEHPIPVSLSSLMSLIDQRYNNLGFTSGSQLNSQDAYSCTIGTRECDDAYTPWTNIDTGGRYVFHTKYKTDFDYGAASAYSAANHFQFGQQFAYFPTRSIPSELINRRTNVTLVDSMLDVVEYTDIGYIPRSDIKDICDAKRLPEKYVRYVAVVGKHRKSITTGSHFGDDVPMPGVLNGETYWCASNMAINGHERSYPGSIAPSIRPYSAPAYDNVDYLTAIVGLSSIEMEGRARISSHCQAVQQTDSWTTGSPNTRHSGYTHDTDRSTVCVMWAAALGYGYVMGFGGDAVIVDGDNGDVIQLSELLKPFAPNINHQDTLVNKHLVNIHPINYFTEEEGGPWHDRVRVTLIPKSLEKSNFTLVANP